MGDCEFRDFWCWPSLYPPGEEPFGGVGIFGRFLELVLWCFNNPFWALAFGFFFLLVMTQPPEFWAALRRRR